MSWFFWQVASIRIFCFSRFRHQSVEVTLIIFVLNDIDRFSVVSNLCKFCTSFFFCQLPILKDVLEVLGHYASVYIKKLCDPILSQPDLAILHTDFNTVVTGILSENEEIDCTVTNGFSVFFVFIPSYDDGRLFHAATPDIPPAHPATSPRNRRYTTGRQHRQGGRCGPFSAIFSVYQRRSLLSKSLSNNATLCPYGICATGCCTNSSSG